MIEIHVNKSGRGEKLDVTDTIGMACIAERYLSSIIPVDNYSTCPIC